MKGILFLDLDGTYIRGNSFHMLLSIILLDWRVAKNIGAPAAFALAKRALRISDHRTFNFTIQKLFLSLADDQRACALEALLQRMAHNTDGRLRALLAWANSQGWHTVLATAASTNYASEFATRSGFQHCIASPSPEELSGWRETRGIEKLRACRTLAEHLRANPNLIVAASDHLEDLPLLRWAKVRIWSGPSEALVELGALLDDCSGTLLATAELAVNQAPTFVDAAGSKCEQTL